MISPSGPIGSIVVGVGVETGDDLVIAFHDSAGHNSHLSFGFVLWPHTAPDHGEPFSRIGSGLMTILAKSPSKSGWPLLSSGAWSLTKSSSNASCSIRPDGGGGFDMRPVIAFPCLFVV